MLKISYICIICIVLFALVLLFVDKISPYDLTITRINGVTFRIKNYVTDNGHLPDNLYILPKRERYDNSIKDGWDKEIIYNVTKNGVVTLKSFGKDKKPGGEGDNSDIIMSFNVKNSDKTDM
ncbi:MAG: type II secretion system protein GspG [Bacteroidales bacterium]|nr:type II secretion system protein GspG [Bacteroidales bacterium]